MTTNTAPTVTPAGTVTLGRTEYRVELVTTEHATTTFLYGPRGAVYFLRGFIYRRGAVDTGVRQVISWKSGAPLRVHGNEVRVVQVGDVIEVA